MSSNGSNHTSGPHMTGKARQWACGASARHYLPTKCLLLLFGILVGAYLSYYGVIFERIDVNMNYYDFSERLANARRLNTNGSTDSLIPNIIHYIWFGKDKPFYFIHYLSYLSIYKIQKPEVIYLHCDHLPTGKWWEKIRQDVPIKVVHRKPPANIHGQRLLHKYHQGDVAKFEILMEHGGIYLDYDILMVNNLNSFRKYELTMGKEKVDKLNAGLIIARKDAVFLQVVYESYRNNYRPFDWDFNVAKIPYYLYLKHPEMVHVEPFRFTTPDWTTRNILWDRIIDWKKLYTVHMMMHMSWADYDPVSIRTLNNTFGEIARYIYYDSKALLQ